MTLARTGALTAEREWRGTSDAPASGYPGEEEAGREQYAGANV